VGDFGIGRRDRASGLVASVGSTRGIGGTACTERLKGLAGLEDIGCDAGGAELLMVTGGGRSRSGSSMGGLLMGPGCTFKDASAFGGEGTDG
jgi:hypothetical protein